MLVILRVSKIFVCVSALKLVFEIDFVIKLVSENLMFEYVKFVFVVLLE